MGMPDPPADAELYVARGVPKAIDYLNSFILDVEGLGCFAAEALLEPGAAGEFIKFSSNSGACLSPGCARPSRGSAG
jgi:hypothetical protein